MNKGSIPVYVLTGFLGSGKTTVLLALLDRLKAEGKRPAVIINEFADADIDGQLMDADIPTASMSGGCICCTIRSDLSLTILKLYEQNNPDVLIIEASGAAHPAEIIEGITDVSLRTRTDLRSIVNVMDARKLLDFYLHANKRETRLYKSQISLSGWLLLNKVDGVPFERVTELERWIRQFNKHSPLIATIRGKDGLGFLASDVQPEHYDRSRQKGSDEDGHPELAVKTYYLDEPLNRAAYQAACNSLPDSLYRIKGIVRFEGEEGLYLIQYAYRKLEILSIRPQKTIQEVLVLIGEAQALDDLNEAMMDIIGF